jgi:DNA-binding MarR family transcriptional regulator
VLANRLHSAMVRMLRRVRATDEVIDLDAPRASLLSVLVFAGPQPVGRLARLEQVSSPAITKMVTALEEAGLVAREHATDDRRSVLVSATPAGRRLMDRGRAARIRELARILDGLSERDQATLRRATEILASRLAS